ncbi:hypothetical protein P7571_43 [Streptococcus phage P7571]|uniref:Uncharacterized protein n=1 Tax=Streptococcus phage P7571 TaxID=1971427 RepID=A0A286QQS3_9CAUD|nr:hypothetical protein PQF00_gp43 [Streptococcus phage P7571]ARU13795.1 hypothetical protein P7571_43 [Streptococcus phage P7571]
MTLSTDQIQTLLGIDEAFQIDFNKSDREDLFRQFLKYEKDMSMVTQLL